MTRMKCWEVPTRGDLEELLTWLVERIGVDRLILTTRLDQEADEVMLLSPQVLTAVDELFDGRILEKRLCSAWPGTELVNHKGLVFLIDFDSSLITPMINTGPHLEDWTEWNSPPLPEDICLFKKGQPWPTLVSVTHEGQAWILSNYIVDIEGVKLTDIDPADLFIPRHSKVFLDD